MNKSELLEIKKIYDGADAPISTLSGAYYSPTGEKLHSFSGMFLTLPEEERFKYVELFKASLSGKTNKNQNCPQVSENADLMQLTRISGETLASAIDGMFDKIAAGLPEVGHLFLAATISYDVPNRNNDKLKDGESDEVYSFVHLIVCPMGLQKAGLEYDGDKIVNIDQRQQVKKPMFGLVYPSFEDRTADPTHVQVYEKETNGEYRPILFNLGLNDCNEPFAVQQSIVPEILNEICPTNAKDYVSAINDVYAYSQESAAPTSITNIKESFNVHIYAKKGQIAREALVPNPLTIKIGEEKFKLPPSVAKYLKVEKNGTKDVLILETPENMDIVIDGHPAKGV